MFLWSFTPSFQLRLSHFQHLILELGHLCSSSSWQNTPHLELINDSWVWRVVCLCVCNRIHKKYGKKTRIFKFWFSKVRGWRRPFACFWIWKYFVSCRVLVGWSARASFLISVYFIYSFERIWLTQLAHWPSGRGGWSPYDPKVKGSTPKACNFGYLFFVSFPFIYFDPILFPTLNYFLYLIYFIILKTFWTWTPFIFVSRIYWCLVLSHLNFFRDL